MNLETLTTDARIIIVITVAVLFGGLLVMTILGIRGAGRKTSLKTELSWPFDEQQPNAAPEVGPDEEFIT